MPNHSAPDSILSGNLSNQGLQQIVDRLIQRMKRDTLVQTTTHQLRNRLGIDRVVLYYFAEQWSGRVTFESLSADEFSILGSTGPDDCFNSDYADMYLAGRVKAIADIDQEAIADCHREFLRGLKVRANLVVPVLTGDTLWGLLVAHHCQSVRPWSPSDIELFQKAAAQLASAPSIRDS